MSRRRITATKKMMEGGLKANLRDGEREFAALAEEQFTRWLTPREGRPWTEPGRLDDFGSRCIFFHSFVWMNKEDPGEPSEGGQKWTTLWDHV